MNNNNLYKYSKDLRDLYVKTKNHDIENLFIKVSETYVDNFQKWLGSNKSKIVKSTLNNPEVFDALLILRSMKFKYPVNISIPDIINYFDKSKYASLFPILISFTKIQDEAVESVLAPYQNILSVISSFNSETEMSLDSIKQDLITIYESFIEFVELKGKEKGGIEKPAKQTKKDKKILMFSELLRKFTSEIQGAAMRSGLDDFANALNNGILPKYEEMNKYVPMAPIDTYMWNEADRILKAILKNLNGNFDVNYNFIKERCMYFVSLISTKELNELYNRRQKQTDFSSFMDLENLPDENVLDKEMETISVSDAKLLSPQYLSMINVFFIVFYRNLKQS